MIPHVTHNDEADITELEAWRKQLNAEQDVKVTMVSFLVVACVADAEGVPGLQLLARRRRAGAQALLQHRVRRRHARQGLVVPVIKDADRKGLLEIARRADRAVGQGPRRQARAGRDERRDVHDLLAGRDRRDLVHADRQRARGRDPRRHPLGDEAGLGRLRVRPAADGAAVAVLRPPGDRRRRRGALRRPPGRACSPTCAGRCCEHDARSASPTSGTSPTCR